jgi:hypothetical protein
MLALGLIGLAASPWAAAHPSTGTPASGIYVTKVTGAPAYVDGTWVLVINGKRYTITRNMFPAVTGNLTASKGQVVFADLTGPYRCTDTQADGTYTVALKGSALQIHAVKDDCQIRRMVLTSRFTSIVDHASIALTATGPAVTTAASPVSQLVARFHFVTAPDTSNATIAWHGPNNQVFEATKPYAPLVVSALSVGKGQALPAGVWSATLSIDGRVVAAAAVRIH